MGALFEVLTFLGSSVCHQLPERSYFLDDLQMPLCARCAGIHLGFLISFVFLWASTRRHSPSLPSRGSLVLLGALMSVFFVDALLSYSGLLPSDNLRRTLSGLAIGVPLPFVLVPLLSSSLSDGGLEGPALLSKGTDWLAFCLLYAIGAGAIIGSTGAYAWFVAASAMGVMGVFVTFSVCITVMLSLALEGRDVGTRSLLPASIILAAVALAVLALTHAA